MTRLLPLLALTSCAELRSGWAHVEFVSGRMESVMVCEFSLQRNPRDGEDELVAECRGVKDGAFLLRERRPAGAL